MICKRLLVLVIQARNRAQYTIAELLVTPSKSGAFNGSMQHHLI
jgi:hypothetical protein